MSKLVFDLYRYQILPINRKIQGDLFDDIKTVEELIARKNDFFYNAATNIKNWIAKKGAVVGVLEHKSDDFLIFKLAPRRSMQVEDKEFNKKYIDTYPSIYVAIWNNPKKQIIAIQRKFDSFMSTRAVLNILEDSINSLLEKTHLRIIPEAISKKNAFWDIVKKHKNNITSVKFELITPNMANISSELDEDLKEFAKDTNASKTTLEISSDSKAPLNIDESIEQLSGAVAYASSGGGNISIKVRNLNKRIQTNQKIKTISLEEVDIIGKEERAVEALKTLIEQEILEDNN